MTRQFLETDKEVLDFIIRHKIENGGDSPTFRQIIDNTSASSTSHVNSILHKLDEMGKIKFGVHQHRSIIIPGMVVSYQGIP